MIDGVGMDSANQRKVINDLRCMRHQFGIGPNTALPDLLEFEFAGATGKRDWPLVIVDNR